MSLELSVETAIARSLRRHPAMFNVELSPLPLKECAV